MTHLRIVDENFIEIKRAVPIEPTVWSRQRLFLGTWRTRSGLRVELSGMEPGWYTGRLLLAGYYLVMPKPGWTDLLRWRGDGRHELSRCDDLVETWSDYQARRMASGARAV